MRITIVQGAFLPVPALLGGAVEKVWFALGREFAAQGHSVTHLSRRYGDLPIEEVIDGVHHRRVPGFQTPPSLFRLKLMDLLYSLRILRHLPPADLLITNTFWLPLLSRDRSRGRIYVHVARYPKGQMRLYNRAARLHAVSRSVAEAIGREAPALASRVRVIPYPLIERVSADPIPPVTETREQRILFVGRIHPEKGLHLLLESLATLPQERLEGWRVTIVGPHEFHLGGGGAEYWQRLHELAKPIAEYVEWAGSIFDPTQLAACYRSASIFVYPSLADRGETFGLAPLEAMSHGCAPIVSDLACFRDFIHDGVDGLAFDHRSNQPELRLAARLEQLMSDPALRSRLGAAALQKAQQYALPRVTAAFLDDFQSLLPGADGHESRRPLPCASV